MRDTALFVQGRVAFGDLGFAPADQKRIYDASLKVLVKCTGDLPAHGLMDRLIPKLVLRSGPPFARFTL